MDSDKKYAVIFDLDGTLLDTLADLRDSVNAALQSFEFPTRTTEEVRQFVGNGIAKLAERAIPEGNANPLYESVLSETRAQYAKRCEDHTAPYAGILPMLKVLSEAGYALGVVSNKPHLQVVELCQKYFGGYIRTATGSQEGIPLKPAPDTVNLTIERLESDRAHAVYVGDSDVDIETARNAGIPCISVLWGFRDRTLLENAGGTLYVKVPSEIPRQLLGIFGD